MKTTAAVLLEIFAGAPFLIVLGLLLLLLWYLPPLYTYRSAFYHKEKHRFRKDDIRINADAEPYRDKIEGLSREWLSKKGVHITIPSYDGGTLAAQYYEVRAGAPLHILAHGYKGNPFHNMSYQAMLAESRGHNVLLIDQRAHFDSSGKTITFGIKERHDILSWITYANEKLNPPSIVLCGVSMGAASVLMALGEPLPPNVVGVLADCPYSRPMEILTRVAEKRRGIPARFARPALAKGARIFGGFDIYETDPLRAIKSSRVPVLLLHGLADTFVPAQMSREIYEARPEGTELVLVENAPHGISSLVEPERYRRACEAFFDKIFDEGDREE